MKVSDLKIKPWLQKTLESVNIKTLTEIQKVALPSAINGDDVIGKLKSKRNDWNWENFNISPPNFRSTLK